MEGDAPGGRTGADVVGEPHAESAAAAVSSEAADEEDAQDATVIQAARRPDEPTRQEIEDHEASGCAQYRSWCRYCVAGQGRAEPHVAHDRGESSICHFCFDYGYMGDDVSDEHASPILISKSDHDRWINADVLQSKGVVHPHSVKVLVTNVVKGGWAKLMMKCDTEAPIVALRAAAAKVLTETHGKSIIFEDPAKAESQSNGLAENTVKQVKGVVRSQKTYIEELHGITLLQDSPVLTWVVRNAAMCINVGRRGRDGRTAYELRRGKPFRRKLIPITEHVLFLPAGKRTSKLATRWVPGIYLGFRDDADEFYVGTESGDVLRARSVKRLTPAQRGNAQLVMNITGVPWKPVAGQGAQDESIEPPRVSREDSCGESCGGS